MAGKAGYAYKTGLLLFRKGRRFVLSNTGKDSKRSERKADAASAFIQ